MFELGQRVAYHPSAGGHRPAQVIGFAERNGVKIVFIDIGNPSGKVATVPYSSLSVQGDLFGEIEIPAQA